MQIIGGKYKGRTLFSPKGKETRPTSGRLRESFFNICQSYIEEADFLDLFAGSGAMGLEALSRGARSATFVDASKEAVRSIQKNVGSLGVEQQCAVMAGQVFQLLDYLGRQKKQFHIIFADPPYNTRVEFGGVERLISEHLIEMIDKGDLLLPGGKLFVEEAARCPIKMGELKQLAAHAPRKFGDTLLYGYTTVN